MIDIDTFFDIPPYSQGKYEKIKLLSDYLIGLTEFHRENCSEYAYILNAIHYSRQSVSNYYDLPFLPVRLFKEYSLSSIHKENVAKTMTSSGTTGQSVSKIFLDKTTSALQLKALTKIVGDHIGSKRMPMIILDTYGVLQNREMFSARGAGIRGFSIFGKDIFYALNDEMELDISGLIEFIDKHKKEKIFLFGFTFMIWQHFYERLKSMSIKIDLSNGILIHGGGWKKLAELNISTEKFKQSLFSVCKITRIYDYYGMVEQTGSIYVECDCGHLHASNLSDVIIRREKDFSVAEIGETGIIEVVSVLPHSYPGHILLTEDEGVILGEDDCACGRKGKYFKVKGRIMNAEIRGCSDTYAKRF